MMVPILDAVQTLNSYGLEVVSGIILGLDTDTADTGRSIIDFIDRSQIPMLTINLLQALPRTPLWDRLEREGRLLADEARKSNVVFRLPYDQVLAMWRQCMATAYHPRALFSRYAHQVSATYPNRFKRPLARERLSWRNIRQALAMLSGILWQVGVRSDYREEFWKFAGPRLLRGDIQSVIAIGLVAHHLITFAREAVSGRQNASHYSAKLQEAA